MITLTGTTRTPPGTDAFGKTLSSSERRSNAEMDRLRAMILGDTTDRVDDISRQVTSRDARVRRLVEDMPDAITKNSIDQGSLVRLANALRAPIEEALNQSVRGNQQKLAEILAPALAQALPQTLAKFFLGLPMALARRVFRVACPWMNRGSRSTPVVAGLAGTGAITSEHAFQVDRICLLQKSTFDVLRKCDAGFEDDATLLEVDHLFAQLADALRSAAPSPTAALRYPRLKAKNDDQGMLVLEREHTIFAAYYKGQPDPSLSDRLKKLADEADALAHATIQESTAGKPMEQRLEALDALLKKGLICHVPAARPSPAAHGHSWIQDAAVVTCVIAVVWLVAAVSRATTQWNQVVQQLDNEAGIVVTDHSWMPGRSITGLRDPLASDPSALVAASGYAPGSVKMHFTSFFSDEAPFKEQRQSLQQAEKDSVRREISSSYARALALMEASLEMRAAAATGAPDKPAGDAREVIRKELLRTLLELPADTNFEFKDGTVTIPTSLPKATRTRIRDITKAIPWVKQLKEEDLPAKSTSMLPGGGIPLAYAGAEPRQER